VLGERLGSGLGVRASAADCGHLAVRFNDVALSAQKERLFFVADQQQCFQMAQELVRPPVFRQLYGGAAQVAVILLQLGFEPAEKCKGIRGRTGESGQDLVVIQAADLLRRVLNDRLAERDLAVSGQNYGRIAAYGQNCGGSNQSLRRHECN
jgi:hypothetical protein